MSNSKYKTMRPYDCVELDGYKEIISYALDGEACNIALVGPNGAGKTSLMKSYAKSVNDAFEFVSLGTLIDSSLRIKDRNSVKNNEVLHDLQLKIIEQLKIGIKPHAFLWKSKLTCELYNFSKLQIAFWTTLLTLFLLSLAVTVACSDLIGGWRHRYQILIYLILFAFPSLLCVQLFISGKHIKSLTRMGLTFEKSEEPFSTYLFDIAYLINLNNSDVFVFEDLDRLEEESFIIGSLRELNANVNKILQNKNSKKKVKFIYCLTDESITDSELLTKSFDFIIPMRSYTDTYNASREFVDLLEVEGVLLEVIKIVQAHVLNSRQIINILNYYYFYVSQFADDIDILSSVNEEDYENRIVKSKIFALCSLRALYPQEYSYLFDRKGIIYWLFSSDGMNNVLKFIKSKYEFPFDLDKLIDYSSFFGISEAAISYDLADVVTRYLPENMGYTFNRDADVFEVPNVLSFVSQMSIYGYIDVNFWIYLSDLKISKLSNNDARFYYSLCSFRTNKYEPRREIDNPSLIIDMLPIDPNLTITCLNYSLVAQLASFDIPARNSIFTSVIRNIQKYRMYDFVNLCFGQKEYLVVDFIRERFAAEWPDYLGVINSEKEKGLDIKGVTKNMIEIIEESRERDHDRLDKYNEYSGDLEESFIMKFKNQ